EEGAPELGKAAGRREVETQPREERASSAAASCAGECAGGDGTTPRPSPPCGAPLPGSSAVTRIELNCSHPNRCSSTPRRSKPAATQIEADHAAPPPPASRPAADHESGAIGVGDGRSTPAMEPPPHRSCRPLPAAGRSEGGGEEAPRPRRRDGKRGTAPRRSRRRAARPPSRLLPSIRVEPWLRLCQTAVLAVASPSMGRGGGARTHEKQVFDAGACPSSLARGV
ncbi:unnamed protein product, partial [Urochloa humidicola]